MQKRACTYLGIVCFLFSTQISLADEPGADLDLIALGLLDTRIIDKGDRPLLLDGNGDQPCGQ